MIDTALFHDDVNLPRSRLSAAAADTLTYAQVYALSDPIVRLLGNHDAPARTLAIVRNREDFLSTGLFEQPSKWLFDGFEVTCNRGKTSGK